MKHEVTPARAAPGNPGICDVSRETKERLDAFAALLTLWSERINLVSRADLGVLWDRHINDSLQLVPLLPREGDCADLGSGAGFPGLILALAANRPFHLVESDRRKAAFLREAARVTSAQVTIHACRIENASIPPISAVTARALAPLTQLIAWSAPLLAPNGFCLFLKGRSAATELTQAAAQWQMRLERWPSQTDPSATILKISEPAPHAGTER